jgi:hypothetical protein
MDRLDQLLARSQREIEAHTDDLINTDTGRYFIIEASLLLAGLRLWAQIHNQTDHAVREVLEDGDVVVFDGVARELRATRTLDGRVAGRSVASIANRSTGELTAVAAYALRAL